jgi:hypothetical protein
VRSRWNPAAWLPEVGHVANRANDGFVWLARTLLGWLDWSPAPSDDFAGGPTPRGAPPPAPSVAPLPIEARELEVEQWLREVFHEDPERRLHATRWLREHRATKALPTLEGALRIEEQGKVREEMANAVHELRPKEIWPPHERGDRLAAP